ncbi:hypothetical protein PX699_12535 [Sphingobium sp. H39-3-25]|uniref:COG3904 family protein n=1 Tax=Sphingobium arseniciresistens TaxID=3030834 RepID=UPI0023B9A1A7|nr:hypothetical protein [Sphingobium arseniciresistens]
MISRGLLLVLAACALTGAASPPPAAMDPKNPSCPLQPDWSANKTMQLSVRSVNGMKVLLAEGVIDKGLMPRLYQALRGNPDLSEIWFRSPGGVASVGNEAGRLIRKDYPNIVTRIPKGWACFSACNFMFMGGTVRIVEPGGLYMVHMFTHVADRAAVRDEIKEDADGAVDMIGDIEQSSALLASDDNDFLIRMGVSRKLLTEVMYQQKAIEGSGEDKSTRRCLTQDELFKYNVANASDG